MSRLLAVLLSIGVVLVISALRAAETAPASAAARAPIRGVWLGTLKTGVTDLRLTMTIDVKPDGSLNGTFNSLDQDAVDRPLDEVTVKDRSVRFVLKQHRIVFRGKLNPAGTQIDGQFKQGWISLPLVLMKVDRAPEPRKRPQEPKPPFPYQEEMVTFENAAAHAKFAGTLTSPRPPGRHPAVLLISGSGQQDRDEALAGHRPFLVIADYLTRHGVAVLRVDDRGVGGSTGDVAKATSEDFAGDAMAAVAYLKTRPNIDPRRIGLVGHSEGGLIAPMVAVHDPQIALIVLLAGPGVTGEQILRTQSAAILKETGVSPAVAKLSGAVQEMLLTALKRDGAQAADDSSHGKPATPPSGKVAAKDGKTVVPPNFAQALTKQISSPWLRFFVTYDPRPMLKKVRCPVLAIIGDKDIQVDAKMNLPEIDKALRAGGNTDFTVQGLPNLNHLFQTCKTGNVDEYARIEETIAPSALELMTNWMRRRFGLK
jgi:hypothetical protein